MILEGHGRLSGALGGVEADGHATDDLLAVSLGLGMHLTFGLTFCVAIALTLAFGVCVELGKIVIVVLGQVDGLHGNYTEESGGKEGNLHFCLFVKALLVLLEKLDQKLSSFKLLTRLNLTKSIY